MNTVNAYEKLYDTMKNTFTVVNDSHEYTLGEYMMMKAGVKKEAPASSNLPAVRTAASNQNAVTAFFRYVNDKLTVKTPPVKDKTIRSFPLRTSLAALFSAMLVCTMLFSYGIATMKGLDSNTPAIQELDEVDVNEEAATPAYTFE